MKNKEIEEMIKNRIEDIYQSGEYIYQAKELEEILSYIEQLEEESKYLKQLCETQNNREYRSKFLKEFQKEKGKNVYPDYDEIYKRYDRLKVENKQLENNRDKAIELLNELSNLYDDNYTVSDKAKDIIDILKGDNNGN